MTERETNMNYAAVGLRRKEEGPLMFAKQSFHKSNERPQVSPKSAGESARRNNSAKDNALWQAIG